MAVRALITKEMLRWARQRTAWSLDEAAKHLGFDKEKLEAWEKGEAQPTYNQAVYIAKKLKIPFGYLYLSEPPVESLPLPDLRVKPGTPPRDPSPDFLDVLYDAMRKQEWYHEYMREEEADPVPFVGRYSQDTSIDTVAEDIRNILGITEEFRRQTQDMGAYYRRLVEQAENAGVLVLRNSFVGNNSHRPLDPYEFQGFAIPDNLAPLVFVNQKDYLSAQIFTLMHELAHIWMGISGVSIQDYLERPAARNEMTQRIANEIAAEILVPKTELTLQLRRYDDLDQSLAALQRYFKVSVFVILRKIYSLGEMPFDIYRSKYEELLKGIKPKKSSGGGGYGTYFSRNSSTIATTLLHSVAEGKTPPTQAASLLNVRPVTVYNMQTYLAERKTYA